MIGVAHSRSTLYFQVIEAVCPGSVAVVGPQVEVGADHHLLGEEIGVLLKQYVPDSFNRRKIELLTEVIQHGVLVG